MSNYPDKIVLGLSGKALTGKTSVADVLRPPFITDQNIVYDNVQWYKADFAAPMYELAAIRQKIEGQDAHDRMLYEIHKVLVDLFGSSPLYGAPPYDELVDLVYEIALVHCEKEGKPRAFLQYIGTDLMRSRYPDVWVNYAIRRIEREYRAWINLEDIKFDQGTKGMSTHFGAVIGDLRFKNEANWVKDQSNGFLVRYTCDPRERQERSERRDGTYVPLEQLSHASENDLDDFPESAFDLILDTTNLSIEEQVTFTLKALKEKVKYGQ